MTTIHYGTWPVAQLTDRDRVCLVYEPGWEQRAWAFPISQTMPLRSGPFVAHQIMPWLANLLPEACLTEIGLQLKISPQDIVGLLTRLGRDTAGALSIGEPRRGGNNFRTIPDEAALERILDELPERPFLVGEQGVSMSLAGVQDKLPVYIGEDGRIAIPVDGTSSTHILKPAIRRLAGSVHNEAFCMNLARLRGLETAEVTTGRAGKRGYLLVKRYDRIADSQGTIRRVHQEDSCQLLGLFPSEKYERAGLGQPGRASLAQMFDALARHVSSSERLKPLDAVIFNILICSSDSHAKNYSILIGAAGTAKLAPLYDLMCATIYKQIDQSLPQLIATERNANQLHGDDWRRFAEDVGLSPVSVIKRVREVANRLLSQLDREHETLFGGESTEMADKLGHLIRRRCRKIDRQLRGSY